MITKILLTSLMIGAGMIASVQAQFLQVQFGAANSPEQKSFHKVVLANGGGKGPMGNNTYVFPDLDRHSCSGTVTLSYTANTEGGRPVAGGCDSRDNGVAPGDDGPYAPLYRSMVFTGRNDIRFQLDGLTPLAAYKIQAWSFPRTWGFPNTVFYRSFHALTGAATGASEVIGKVECPAGASTRLTPDAPTKMMVEFTLSADASGRLVIGPSNLNTNDQVEQKSKPIINGFSITLAKTSK